MLRSNVQESGHFYHRTFHPITRYFETDFKLIFELNFYNRGLLKVNLDLDTSHGTCLNSGLAFNFKKKTMLQFGHWPQWGMDFNSKQCRISYLEIALNVQKSYPKIANYFKSPRDFMKSKVICTPGLLPNV